MHVICMKCSSYLYNQDIQGIPIKEPPCTSYKDIIFMDSVSGGPSLPFEHHVLGWVKIEEYECPKIRCSNVIAIIEKVFVTEEE
jgi:hypothetical protein